MRICSILSVFLAACVAGGSEVEDAAMSDAHDAATTFTPRHAGAMSIFGADGLELRTAPGLAPINAAPSLSNSGSLNAASSTTQPTYSHAGPTSPSANTIPSLASPTPSSSSKPALAGPAIIIPSSEAVSPPTLPTPAVPPPPSITETNLAAALESGFFTTTQWVETWIDGTSRTWVPQTITLRYKAVSTPLPPGKGTIGMGSLTGRTGVTRTVWVGGAAAQTGVVVRGMVAVGVGVVGMVV